MNDKVDEVESRRVFLQTTGTLIAGSALMHPLVQDANAKEREAVKEGEKVSPPEDLMREHGVLRRILLVYENIRDRLIKGTEFPPEVLSGAAETIRKFIEDYHEKLEENYLFPRFEKAGKLLDLVEILKKQHKAGRNLTESIITSYPGAMLKEESKRNELAAQLSFFIRMYRPHASREDTVLFPALRSIVSSQEFYSLGEVFEDKEVDLFGEGGFERVVEHVAELEKPLGIYDLAQFTPPQ
jgi:hemerythrin-like domain-containing protein